MLKRLISLLLAAMLLLGASALADKNVNELIENALYRIVLRTDAGDSILGSGVLCVESNVLLTPASCSSSKVSSMPNTSAATVKGTCCLAAMTECSSGRGIISG